MKRGLTGQYENVTIAGETVRALIPEALLQQHVGDCMSALDGNNRIGRLLITFVLRTEGNWEDRLDSFVEGVEHTANNAVETARRLIALFQKDEQAIQRAQRNESTVLRVFHALRERPLVTVKDVCRRTDLSFPRVAKSMERLEQAGIVREITGRKRDRVFAHGAYFKILSEGIEPV